MSELKEGTVLWWSRDGYDGYAIWSKEPPPQHKDKNGRFNYTYEEEGFIIMTVSDVVVMLRPYLQIPQGTCIKVIVKNGRIERL